MSSYKEKFLDPRWQKKRLLILQRDNFSCCQCGDEKSTLHVHHKYYTFGIEPWDYPNELIETLCVDCHKQETWESLDFKGTLKELLSTGWTYAELNQYLSGLVYPINIPNMERARIASFVAGNEEQLANVENILNDIWSDFFNLVQQCHE